MRLSICSERVKNSDGSCFVACSLAHLSLLLLVVCFDGIHIDIEQLVVIGIIDITRQTANLQVQVLW